MTKDQTRNEGGARHAPIAVFAYNRPDHLANMLNSLRQCEGFVETPVTVFVDGPKHEKDRAAVEAVRGLLADLALPNLEYMISEENRGLRNSIYGGVSEILKGSDRVIVLEDDLVLSTKALEWFNMALERYKDDPRVWSVSGYVADIQALRDHPRALVLPIASSWGWATWSRAWQQFDLDAHPCEENLKAKSFRQAFSVNGMYPFHGLLRNSLEGTIDSWAIHWSYTIFQNGGRSIFPPRRLVDNFGHSDGTHGSRLNPMKLLVTPPPLLERLPELPAADEIDYFAMDLMKKCQETRAQRAIASAGMLKRRLRR